MNIKAIPRYSLGFLLTGFTLIGILIAEGFVTREEALDKAFPEAEVRRETLFLTADQQKEAAALSGAEVPTGMIARYTALKDGEVIGRAYVDTHTVKTEKESLLIILDADGLLLRIETTASAEGPEHQAPREWYRQYEGMALNDDMFINRAIRPIAGATLTALATNRAVRRILAIDKIMGGQKRNQQ